MEIVIKRYNLITRHKLFFIACNTFGIATGSPNPIQKAIYMTLIILIIDRNKEAKIPARNRIEDKKPTLF
jgi:hypothetical protein